MKREELPKHVSYIGSRNKIFRAIFYIIHNLSVHTSAQVKAYLETKNDRFEFVGTP